MEDPRNFMSLEEIARRNRLDERLSSEAEQEKEKTPPTARMTGLRLMSNSALIREVQRLEALIQKADMANVVLQAREKRADMREMPAFKHAEAFRLMTYRSEGRTEVLRIWNSRDGVTPFICHVNGLKFTHDIKAMEGPFLDRPEECDAQWETRTVKQMLEAWERSINRAVLAGKIDGVRAFALKGDVGAAKSWNLHIGLRDLDTGKFTDDF